MSAQPPTTLDGSQAPSQIEFLWERYRPWVWTIVAMILLALGLNYGWKYYKQKEVDATWSRYASTIGLDEIYADKAASPSLLDSLAEQDLATLEGALAGASDAQRPFLLLAIARRAMIDRNWDRADSALGELEQKYPNHSLVKSNDYPVQIRKPLDPDAKPAPGKQPELQPAVAGSVVSLMRKQIQEARGYAEPAQFAKVGPAPDAKKVKITFSNGSSVTLAMMPEYAPKHVEAFLALAADGEGGYWKSMAVDEIQRPIPYGLQVHQMHIGFASTREDDRTKWNTTDPCTKPLDFEANKLSHFAGAVSARNEADGKSCADRFWIVADDASIFDGERVVFAYVVEGLEAVKSICESTMSAQEEQAGRGRPTENIRVTEVTILP